MGIPFGSAPFFPLLHARELPEFATLSGADVRDPWATSFGEVGLL